jgi:hypothetical protein
LCAPTIAIASAAKNHLPANTIPRQGLRDHQLPIAGATGLYPSHDILRRLDHRQQRCHLLIAELDRDFHAQTRSAEPVPLNGHAVDDDSAALPGPRLPRRDSWIPICRSRASSVQIT